MEGPFPGLALSAFVTLRLTHQRLCQPPHPSPAASRKNASDSSPSSDAALALSVKKLLAAIDSDSDCTYSLSVTAPVGS